jgi:hypothetical protein
VFLPAVSGHESGSEDQAGGGPPTASLRVKCAHTSICWVVLQHASVAVGGSALRVLSSTVPPSQPTGFRQGCVHRVPCCCPTLRCCCAQHCGYRPSAGREYTQCQTKVLLHTSRSSDHACSTCRNHDSWVSCTEGAVRHNTAATLVQANLPAGFCLVWVCPVAHERTSLLAFLQNFGKMSFALFRGNYSSTLQAPLTGKYRQHEQAKQCTSPSSLLYYDASTNKRPPGLHVCPAWRQLPVKRSSLRRM